MYEILKILTAEILYWGFSTCPSSPHLELTVACEIVHKIVDRIFQPHAGATVFQFLDISNSSSHLVKRNMSAAQLLNPKAESRVRPIPCCQLLAPSFFEVADHD